MSAPRTSMRALRVLSASSRQVRRLHMTGPATYASPVLTGDMEQSKRATIEASNKASEPSSFAGDNASGAGLRHFNTSRALKALNDTSTIDFAYFPEIDPDMDAPQPQIRVPLLPTLDFQPSSTKTSYTAEEEEIVMRPEISLMSADSTHISTPSAFAEVHDNSAIDFEGMADRIAQNTKKVAEDHGGNTVKQVWNGFLEDLFGGGKPAKS